MITAKIIADSVAPNGKRITTFELEYPRFVHSEFMTHRMVSKNAASSRAIPIEKVIEGIISNPAMPVWWGKNQSGMQAKEELSDDLILEDRKTLEYPLYERIMISPKSKAQQLWLKARDSAIKYAEMLAELGLHKQIVNRILEPWVTIKIIATATDWDNFFYLRNHPDAQPEIHELARVMVEAYKASEPRKLKIGEWHLPYVETRKLIATNNPEEDYLVGKRLYFWGEKRLDLETALKLSASLCAQVSYRKADESIEKALKIYDRLVESKPVHASPFEHQATPADEDNHISGNLRGWIQYRQTIKGNTCYKYDFGDDIL